MTCLSVLLYLVKWIMTCQLAQGCHSIGVLSKVSISLTTAFILKRQYHPFLQEKHLPTRMQMFTFSNSTELCCIYLLLNRLLCISIHKIHSLLWEPFLHVLQTLVLFFLFHVFPYNNIPKGSNIKLVASTKQLDWEIWMDYPNFITWGLNWLSTGLHLSHFHTINSIKFNSFSYSPSPSKKPYGNTAYHGISICIKWPN